VKKKFVVETVSNFYDVHIVEAEDQQEAEFISQKADSNASKYLGQQIIAINEYDEKDLKRLMKVDSHLFSGYATIENSKLIYRTMDDKLHGEIPEETINYRRLDW